MTGRAGDGGIRDTLTSLVTFRPAPGPRWPIALQAAIAIAAPILVLTALGQPSLGYQAAAGAFTALHVSQLRPGERAKVLPFVAVALIVCAALGALVGPSIPLTLAGLVFVTAAAASFVYGFRLGAPGSLFFVLIFGLCAHITGSAPDAEPLVLVAAIAAGSVFAYLVCLAPLLRARVRNEPTQALRILMPTPAWDAAARTLFLRAVLVGVIGAVAGIWIDPERAYWIVAAGVAVVGIAIERRVTIGRALHRMVGTVVGAGLYFVLILVPWAGVALAALLGALQFAIEMVVVRNYALALVFITPLVLLLTGAATGDTGSVAVAGERVIDTIVGSVLGAAVSLLPALRDARD